MPELPEVLTITRDLDKEVRGKKVVGISTKQRYALNPSKSHFAKFVAGSSVSEVSNIAKLITIKMSSGYYIATHLNMSGRLLYNNEDPYIKISIRFDTGDILHYSSVRMFGYFEVWDTGQIGEYRNRYGKTALDETLTTEEFIAQLKRKNTHIKDALLDQKLISGIGNIYANDALYLSGIHPQTKPNKLSDVQIARLFENIKKLLMEGLKHRGSTIDRYCDIYGNPGSHQNHFKIYQKEHCAKCDKEVEFFKLSGRGTYFCPTCQPHDNQVRLL